MTTPDSAPTPEILRARMVSRWMGLIEEAYQSRDDILTSAGYTPRSLGLNFVADQIRAEVERLAAQSVPFKREDLTLAAVNCQHQIDADCVRLWRDETREGSALSQLVDRVVAVVAQSVSADTGGEEVRMLTKEEVVGVVRTTDPGLGLLNALQRAFCKVNAGKRIPADGEVRS
mgnify:CR=1 FL=1